MPICITTVCMVEALVTNGGPEASYDLIHEILADEQMRSPINAVIYNSVF